MKSINQLTEFYYTTLYPRIIQLEQKRKEIRFRITVIFIILASLGVSLFYFLTDKLQHTNLFITLFFVISFLASNAFIVKFLAKDYIFSFKTQIIEPLLKEIEPTLTYNPADKIQQQTFVKSELFKEPIERYNGSDYVSGSIDGVAIRFCDLCVEKKEQDSKGHTNHTKNFQGLFLVTSFNKHFFKSTIILPDFAQNLFGSLVGAWFQSNNFTREQLIKMDDPEFEKEFVVYASDSIEAHYILSHSMMQRILDLKKKSKRALYISFEEGEMYLGISYEKALFTPSLSSSLLEYKVALEYIKTLHFALAIVTELKLNERLWSKR